MSDLEKPWQFHAVTLNTGLLTEAMHRLVDAIGVGVDVSLSGAKWSCCCSDLRQVTSRLKCATSVARSFSGGNEVADCVCFI